MQYRSSFKAPSLDNFRASIPKVVEESARPLRIYLARTACPWHRRWAGDFMAWCSRHLTGGDPELKALFAARAIAIYRGDEEEDERLRQQF